ncbi:MAG: diacylglycerol kinase family protein [Halioglobus sp.]
MSWLSQRSESFGYAFRGVVTLIKEQPNAQIHALATIGVVALAFYCEISPSEWRSLILMVSLVWLAEGLNTSLEYLADAAVPEQHPLIEKAKDVAAAAVLITAFFAVVMAALIFLPLF